MSAVKDESQHPIFIYENTKLASNHPDLVFSKHIATLTYKWHTSNDVKGNKLKRFINSFKR